VTLGEKLRAILDSLPAGWSEARIVVSLVSEADADHAALILGSLAPGRSGTTFRIRVSASGLGGPSPDAAQRVLERLDGEGIDARLSLPGTAAFQAAAPAPPEAPRALLAESWDEQVSRLPADWSDLYLELELASSADTDRGALLLGPVNPFLQPDARPAFRFRAARRASTQRSADVVLCPASGSSGSMRGTSMIAARASAPASGSAGAACSSKVG